MKQLNLFDTIDLETSMPEPNNNSTENPTTETLWSVERLEGLRSYPFGKTFKSVAEQHADLKSQGRFMDARYLASEWEKTWSDEF